MMEAAVAPPPPTAAATAVVKSPTFSQGSVSPVNTAVCSTTADERFSGRYEEMPTDPIVREPREMSGGDVNRPWEMSADPYRPGEMYGDVNRPWEVSADETGRTFYPNGDGNTHWERR